MPLNTNTKNKILRSLVGKDSAFGGSIYLGLSSTTPNAAGGNITEPTGNGYERVLIGTYSQSGTQKFGDVSNDSITNNEIIYFPESTGSWGNILTHFVLFTNKTSTGDSYVLAFGELTTPITVSAADTVVLFRKGELTVTYSD
jgi:hypothetical protein